MIFKSTSMAIGLLMVISCGVQQEGNLDSSMNPNAGFSGAYSDNVNIASYETKSDESGAIDSTITVNGKTIEATYTSDNMLSEVRADISFDENDKRALKNLHAEIISNQSSDSNLKDITSRLTDYLSESPAGHRIPSRTFNTDLSLYDEGVKCIKKGQWVYAEWDTASGQKKGYNTQTNVNWGGNYGCMGRCGAGCGWGAPSAYTKDCMDHDVCSIKQGASGGSGDPNCGDEYNQAMDDWAQGVARGCNG